MGSVTKSGKGWRAQVRVVGFPGQYRSFGPKEKSRAWAWVDQVERDLKLLKRGAYPSHTVQEALERFRQHEAPQHKGERWEAVRTRKFETYPVSQKLIGDVTDDDMAHWREARLKQVSKGTVRREMVLWGQVFEYAREKLRWIPTNVMRHVRKPSAPRSKPKKVSAEFIEVMVDALGSAQKSREVALAYLLACETAMRPWEMIPLTKDQVFWRDCYLHLEETKNGDERDVPLSPGAIEILAELEAMNPGPDFFTVTEGSVTKLWADARARAGYTKGIHFRHSRREGIRRLSKRLRNPLDLARAVGHRDLNSLMIYYQESASEMAQRLVHRTTPSPSPPSSAGEPHPSDTQEPGSPVD